MLGEGKGDWQKVGGAEKKKKEKRARKTVKKLPDRGEEG